MSQKKDDRAFKAYIHANQRMEQRYGVRWESFQDYLRDCNVIREGEGENRRKGSDDTVEAWLPVKGTWVCMTFHQRDGYIRTVLPFAQNQPPAAGDTRELERLKAQLAEAEHQLGEATTSAQTARAKADRLENELRRRGTAQPPAEQIVVLQNLLAMERTRRQELEARLKKAEKKGAAVVVGEPQPSGSERQRRVLGWLKEQNRLIYRAIRDGLHQKAIFLAHRATSVPNDLDPLHWEKQHEAHRMKAMPERSVEAALHHIGDRIPSDLCIPGVP